MTRCAGYKSNGEPCERIVGALQRWCPAHDPARSEQRSRAASKAARSRGTSRTKDTEAVKDQLQTIADAVLDGRLDRADAYAATQALNVKLKALELLRGGEETDQLGAEIRNLEERMEGA